LSTYQFETLKEKALLKKSLQAIEAASTSSFDIKFAFNQFTLGTKISAKTFLELQDEATF